MMFAILAATIFSVAFLMAVGTMAWMFAMYRDKMVAALLFDPIPLAPPVYQLRITRRRVDTAPRPRAIPVRAALA